MRKILILGCTGMLGHKLFMYLSTIKTLDVYATSRFKKGLTAYFQDNLVKKIKTDVNVEYFDSVIRTMSNIKPDLVINCIGIIKQSPLATDPITAINVNSLLPHQLAMICKAAGSRFVHISTDCVFDGKNGRYTEKDSPNAQDLYGRTKSLGEVEYPHCTTLRTSIIGHELNGFHGLIEWFLRQKGSVKGYKNAFFTGFPTIELAHIIGEYVIPNNKLRGVYQVASNPISKFDLLKTVAAKYRKELKIEAFEDYKINRSLDATLFNTTTGYSPPTWQELVDKMYNDYLLSDNYKGQKSGYHLKE